MADRTIRALLVDLNNFARYPTLAIGYLVAALRESGTAVEVLSPLSYGVPATEHERRETLRQHLERRVYFSTHPLTVKRHDLVRALRSAKLDRPNSAVLAETNRALTARRPDVLLLSAYVDQYPSVKALGRLAQQHGVPVLLGGPVFNVHEIAREWVGTPGVTAIVGGEVDRVLPELVAAAVDGADLAAFPGVFTADGDTGPAFPPLQPLAGLPVPDFSDFPWDRYPRRVIPIMASRGCSWGRCLFCGDVRTANGRGFRPRPLEDVLDELSIQSERYGTKDFIFLDIKLNSDLPLWRGIIEGFQRRIPDGRWIGTVHVAARGENGLTSNELEAAWGAGMRRTTFGFETGSQRLNDSMAKGTSLQRTSQFVKDAHAAGLSVRTTAMLGWPGERAEDIDASTRFLSDHGSCLDRVRISRFKAIPGTRFHELYERFPDRYADLGTIDWNYRLARGRYRYEPATQRSYRRSKARLLRLVHRINSRPLRFEARAFDGLM